MKKLLFLFCLLLFSLSGIGQIKFSITPQTLSKGMNSINITIIGEEVFVVGYSGHDVCFHYNGSDWQELDLVKMGVTSLGHISGYQKADGSIYALFMSDIGFFSWNHQKRSWERWEINRPWELYNGAASLVISDSSSWWSTGFERKGQIWHFDGVDFTKKLDDTLMVYGPHYADSQGVYLDFWDRTSGKKGLALLSDNNLSYLCIIPDNRGHISDIWSNDKKKFFILTEKGDIYLWDNLQKTMSTINVGMDNDWPYSYTIFTTPDNRNIFTAGSRGIKHFYLDQSNNVIYMDTLQPWVGTNLSWRLSCSDYKDNKAYLGGNHGLFFEMQFLTSVNESITEENCKIFPNPATSYLQIQIPVIGLGKKKLEIYNLSGQLLISKSFLSLETKIDISHLERGLYLLHLSDDQGRRLVKKIIKE